MNLTRVVVVGTSGSGKTTLARRLATSIGTPHVELDSLHWGPGWTPQPDFEQQVLAAARQPGWVADGNYSAVRDILWRRCTAIVWLDYSFARVFSRVLRRTIRRVVMGERLYGGNRETIGSTVFDVEAPLWLVARTHGKRRREFPELFRRSEYRHVTVMRLHAPAAAEALLVEARGGEPRRAANVEQVLRTRGVATGPRRPSEFDRVVGGSRCVHHVLRIDKPRPGASEYP